MGNKDPRFPHVETFGRCSTANAMANAYIEVLLAVKELTKNEAHSHFTGRRL